MREANDLEERTVNMQEEMFIVLSGIALFLIAGFFGIAGIFQILKQKVKVGIIFFASGSFLVIVYIVLLIVYFTS